MSNDTTIVVPVNMRLPLSSPRPGVAGKTGWWRTKRPVVDNDACIRCYLCELYCPVNVIRVEKESGVSIDYTYCKGCGICMEVCPKNAITMIDEHKHTVEGESL